MVDFTPQVLLLFNLSILFGLQGWVMQPDVRSESSAVDRGVVLGLIPLNIPNSLTILRIILVPVFVGFLIYEHYDYALITLIIAAITDGLDGTIARLANQSTQFGAYLDPLADKLLLMSAFITLSILELVPVWSVILVVSRDAILLTGTLLAKLTDSQIDSFPTALGKATTVFQLAYIIFVVLFAARPQEFFPLDPLLYLMSAFTFASGFHYLLRGITQLHFPPSSS